ncbi:MAG: long-chain fatty acid--CoA ligase [Pirellulaceae bacterium]|nr:long-chain fatty acid--CoA ligase [Pirellulaceae bacterium]
MSDNWFHDRLAGYGDRCAIVWREREFSYVDLLRRVEQWQNALAERGIEPGQCVALSGGFSPGTATLLTALAANRNIAVPLTTKVRAERDRALKIAAVRWVVDFDRNDEWKLTPLQKGTVPFSSDENRDSPPADPPLLDEIRKNNEAGLIVFSSGSTGEVKASLLSFTRLLNGYRDRRATPLRTLAFLMLDHVGGINTLFHILAGGGTIVTLAERTPEAICGGIERHRVQLLPTTPTFLRMLLISEAYKKHDLGSLELITYGTEPMPEATLKALHAALPGVRLKQTYGLTEVGILPTKSERNDSLWLAVGGKGFETKVVDGVLWIRSATAMIGYLNAPSPFDDEGWMNTGDLVEQQGEYIRFVGRKSEIINIGGEKVFPIEVENVIQQVENIKDVTVRGRSNPITGNIVIATVELHEPEDADAVEKRVRNACRASLAPFKVPAMVEIAEETLCGERFKKKRKVGEL